MGLEAYRRNGIPIDDFITIPQEGCQYENPDQPSCSIQYNSYVFQWEYWFKLYVPIFLSNFYSILIYFSGLCRYFKTNQPLNATLNNHLIDVIIFNSKTVHL